MKIHPRPALLLAGVACAQLACASAGPGSPPPLEGLWREYLELPDQRALAIAGDPESAQWVAGATGGHRTRAEAERQARAECMRRRGLRRMQAPCRLYAVGSQIVWHER